MPTSNETRVRVEDFEKSMAQILPLRGSLVSWPRSFFKMTLAARSCFRSPCANFSIDSRCFMPGKDLRRWFRGFEDPRSLRPGANSMMAGTEGRSHRRGWREGRQHAKDSRSGLLEFCRRRQAECGDRARVQVQASSPSRALCRSWLDMFLRVFPILV